MKKVKIAVIGCGHWGQNHVKTFSALQIGWMSHAGEKPDSGLICPREERKHPIKNDVLIEI